MKIRLAGDELFHVDRRKDVTKLTAAYRDFPRASKNSPEALIVQLEVSRIRVNFLHDYTVHQYYQPLY